MIRLLAIRKILIENQVTGSDRILSKSLLDFAKPLFDKFEKQIDLRCGKDSVQEKVEDTTSFESQEKFIIEKNSATVSIASINI
jgi:hypothetical protein